MGQAGTIIRGCHPGDSAAQWPSRALRQVNVRRDFLLPRGRSRRRRRQGRFAGLGRSGRRSRPRRGGGRWLRRLERGLRWRVWGCWHRCCVRGRWGCWQEQGRRRDGAWPWRGGRRLRWGWGGLRPSGTDRCQRGHRGPARWHRSRRAPRRGRRTGGLRAAVRRIQTGGRRGAEPDGEEDATGDHQHRDGGGERRPRAVAGRPRHRRVAEGRVQRIALAAWWLTIWRRRERCHGDSNSSGISGGSRAPLSRSRARDSREP